MDKTPYHKIASRQEISCATDEVDSISLLEEDIILDQKLRQPARNRLISKYAYLALFGISILLNISLVIAGWPFHADSCDDHSAQVWCEYLFSRKLPLCAPN